MNKQQLLVVTERYVKDRIMFESSGHDWWHIYRVVQMSKTIAEIERADTFICQMSALLHDLTDDKLCKNPAQLAEQIKKWLVEQRVDHQDITRIYEIIDAISYKAGQQLPLHSIESQVVQDADRLDAIGAIGIARVFTYSGFTDRPIHHPDQLPRENLTLEQYRSQQGTAIMHFYEKLLKLKNLMNTAYAKKLADNRHQFMEQYLEQFYLEWQGMN